MQKTDLTCHIELTASRGELRVSKAQSLCLLIFFP